MLNDGRTSIPMHSFLSVNVQMTSERGSDSWLYIHLPGASLRSFGITEFREGQGARFFASVRQPRQAMCLYVLEPTALRLGACSSSVMLFSEICGGFCEHS